jgi:hypothetical protein
MPKNSSKDRALLCTFTFSDGRQCQLPRYTTAPDFCYFHARKMARRLDAEAAGKQIAAHLNTDFVTACDLSHTFATLFSATAQGYIKPKTATTLAYLGQLMLQTHIHAKQEFQEAFTKDSWQNAILAPFPDDDDEPSSPASPNSDSPAPAPISIDSANAPAATHPADADSSSSSSS